MSVREGPKPMGNGAIDVEILKAYLAESLAPEEMARVEKRSATRPTSATSSKRSGSTGETPASTRSGRSGTDRG